MRGIVTLAGALAIPLLTGAGQPFPGRALILYLAFTTIVITLVGQGLTLPWIVRRFGSGRDDSLARDLALAQLRLATAGRERVRELEAGFTTTQEWEAASRVIGMLEQRIARANAKLNGDNGEQAPAAPLATDRSLQLAVCEAERHELETLRVTGEIGDRAFRQTQYEIDLIESLVSQSGPEAEMELGGF